MIANQTDFSANKTWRLLLALVVGAGAGVLVLTVDSTALLVMGVLALAVGYLALVRLEYGLLALIFITYIRLSDVLISFHGAPSIAKLVVPAVLLLILARWFLFRDPPAPWEKVAILLTIYGLIGFASLLYADDSARVWEEVVDFAKDALIAVVVVMILRRRLTLHRVVWTLLAAGIFLGTLSTVQFVTGAFDNNFWGFAQADLRNIVGSTTGYRIAGPISSNYFALIMVALVPFALDRFWHERSPFLRFLAGWALVVTVATVIFTFSRGGFLALVAVGAVMLIRRRPALPALLATLAVIALLWPFVPDQYSARIGTLFGAAQTDITTQDEGAIRGRYVEIVAGWQMFADHPILGVGLANYNNNYLDYAEHIGLVDRTEDRSAHSLYLEIAAETGILGLLSFGAIIWFVFGDLRSAYRRFRQLQLDDEANLTIAMTVSLVGYLIGSIFLHLSYGRYLWLLLGIAFAFRNIADHEAEALPAAADQIATGHPAELAS